MEEICTGEIHSTSPLQWPVTAELYGTGAFLLSAARIAATAIRERDSAFFERRRPRARGLAASEARGEGKREREREKAILP